MSGMMKGLSGHICCLLAIGYLNASLSLIALTNALS